MFIASLVFKLFKERWYNEVDTFYINYNNYAQVPIDVAGGFLRNVIKDPKVHLIYHPQGIGPGLPLKELALIAKEDYIMLLEEDGFIFESGEVDRCFKMIENGECDIVGSPRGSCGQEVWEASKVKYGLDYSGYGDMGPNWWPNFFFCKKADLLKTDLNFGSIAFQPGEYYKELDYTFKELNNGDTFVWTSMQLRALGLKAKSVPQHKADPFEITHKETREQNWHPTQQPFKWLHAGSLSSGIKGYLSGAIPDVSNDSAKQDMESRVAFWSIAVENTEGFDEFKKLYIQGIMNLVENAQLNKERIARKKQIYLQLMNL